MHDLRLYGRIKKIYKHNGIGHLYEEKELIRSLGPERTNWEGAIEAPYLFVICL